MKFHQMTFYSGGSFLFCWWPVDAVRRPPYSFPRRLWTEEDSFSCCCNLAPNNWTVSNVTWQQPMFLWPIGIYTTRSRRSYTIRLSNYIYHNSQFMRNILTNSKFPKTTNTVLHIVKRQYQSTVSHWFMKQKLISILSKTSLDWTLTSERKQTADTLKRKDSSENIHFKVYIMFFFGIFWF